ncbi:hypothetical protein DL96DRAFT_919786 [Flagelloscypha sp. PMI_526]|nr:hypothetical protein DL96DRAFT_919786 [Flagelloscypha sp. PMI_526]
MKFTIIPFLLFSVLGALAAPTPMPDDVPRDLVHLEARSCGAKMSQADAAAKLKANGITTSSSGGCSTKSNASCTSLSQICTNTVNTVITLKKAAGLKSLIITGGTEVGHASGTNSHSNGHKVDLRHSTGLDKYIHSTFKKIATRSDGAIQFKAASGNIYADEGSHWDVTIF